MTSDRIRRAIPGLGRLVGRPKEQLRDPAPQTAPPVIEDAPPPPAARATRPRGMTGDAPALAASSAPGAPPMPLDIYTEHFGLTMRPFALAPDPDFLFWPPSHRRAYTMLEYGVMTHAPITLITGEIGAGKTTLLHHLLRSLGSDVRVGLISNPSGARSELLRWVLMSLDQPALPDETYVDLFARFQTFLIDEYANGRRIVLIIDEAQNLSREALEELRMFTNINSGKDELLQLVLVGQPELRDIISRPDLRQFAQRIASNFHLTPMDLDTVRAYISHRLKVAGRKRRVFNDAAVDLVFKATGGVPRLVNRLCDLALLYAFTKGRKQVGPETVQQVLDDGAFFTVNAPVEMGNV